MFFTFPEDARWNAERQAVEFGVEIGEYSGVVRVPRRVFQRLLSERPTPERRVEAYYLQRTRFETGVRRKLRRRLLIAWLGQDRVYSAVVLETNGGPPRSNSGLCT
jgi:hypothetical protein